MLPPILKTDKYTLKAYSKTDEDRFVEIALDKVSTHFMGGSTGIEAEERKMFSKVFEIYKRKDKRWFWLWGIYKDDLLCGHIELKDTEHTNEDELEVVYMIHPDERRKGIMFEVLKLLQKNQTSWKRKIIATVSSENKNSILLLEKCGIAKKELLENSESGSFKITLNELI